MEADHGYSSSFQDVDFSLASGELAIVRLEPGEPDIPLADAALGLIEPGRGSVEFLGRDWTKVPPGKIAALRARTGRVFEGRGWLSNLNIDENIYLAQRYHTNRPYEEIAEEAAELGRKFGLPTIPAARPGKVRPIELQRAACVRAFLGKPKLLILEFVTIGVAGEILHALLDEIHIARQRGSAVLWTTTDPIIWQNPALEPTFRFTMMGTQMQLTERIPCPNPSNSAT